MRHKTTTVNDIYAKYQIPPNLQKHQLGVAYLCHEITNKWIDSSINRWKIIEAGLFHDMGNLIKFNFKNPSMLEGEDPKTWQEIQKTFIRRYGSHVHQATLFICQEIGLGPDVIRTVELANWDDTPELIKTNNLSACILLYADMRVSPFGITSYHDRITDLQQRSPSDDYYQRLQYAKNLEQLLQSHTSSTLTDLNDAHYATFSRNMALYQIQAA